MLVRSGWHIQKMSLFLEGSEETFFFAVGGENLL